PLYIADGHHRYETAVAHARENPGADRVLAFIVSAADPGLTVLPTHRVIFAPGRDIAQLVTRWRRWFDVGRVAPCADRIERLAELLNPTKVEQVFAVADAGDVMPPKSTYFVPKVPSGLVLRPITETTE